MLDKEPQNLELSLEDIDETIQSGDEAISQVFQQIGLLVTEASNLSRKVGRYQELRVHKELLIESENATKH